MNALENNTWHVQSWAGTRMFPKNMFASFDEGWVFVQTEILDESQHEDIYVVTDYDNVGVLNIGDKKVSAYTKRNPTFNKYDFVLELLSAEGALIDVWDSCIERRTYAEYDQSQAKREALNTLNEIEFMDAGTDYFRNFA